jgi:3-hydroxyacyl-CoA dehydrogenase
MSYDIRKAAVIGSGTMGAGIAGLLAGVGIPVVLLDIPDPKSSVGDGPAKRNSIVNGNLKRLQTSRPAQLFKASDINLIRGGNTEDNLDLLADVDWIIEVIVEKLSIKQDLMAKIEKVRKQGSIITSNTSGLSIKGIADGRSDEFRSHFLGTHFFNPPRYLKLLEIIPHPDTDPALIDFMLDFGTRTLGKGCVICKDTPNFIANRFISIIGSIGMNYAVDNGFTVDEIDAISGPLIGHPSTASFRLLDLVGNDVHAYVARNLYDAIPDDPWRDVLKHEGTERVFEWLIENNYLGRKTGQGFYKTVVKDGQKVFMPLNLQTLEYEEPQKVRFESVGKHRKIEDTGARIKALINEDDRAADYIWNVHAGLFAYASEKLGEIADTIVDIDNANKWGFVHELGPFEIWDAVGVAETLPRLANDGYVIAAWVGDMLENGCPTFYERDDKNIVTGYYDPNQGGYLPLERDKNVIIIDHLRANGKEIERNDGASILDLGDGVALLEFHSKLNSIDPDTMQMTYRALELLENDFDGLVIGNQGGDFCVGANLMMFVMAAMSDQFDQLDEGVRTLQNALQALRAAPKPVVIAPFGRVLGGGAEYTMAGAAVVAHAESYVGVVEVGVGVIPAGSGTKELMKRYLNPVMEESPNADILPHLQRVFEQIAMAKFSESAMQAQEMHFLRSTDRIVMNRDHLIAEAKAEVLRLIPTYQPQKPGKVWAAGRDAYSALKLGAWSMREAGYATEYDIFIAEKLAYILTGGALSEPQWVDEQYILDLEREAFVDLCKQEKTMARIQHMLETGKPLRN